MLSFAVSPFPFLDHFDHIGNFPEAGVYASSHCLAHAVRAVNFHEIVVHGVKGEGVDMVFQLL